MSTIFCLILHVHAALWRNLIHMFCIFLIHLADFNDKAVKAAKEAGFHLAVTTMKGKVKPGDNPLLLKRLYILRTDSLETMSRLVSNQPQG